MDIERLIVLHPCLFHMAEAGAWDSIRHRGLLSTSAILDLSGIAGADRSRIESGQRMEKEVIAIGSAASIVLRDQKPMPRSQLLVALQDGITPEEWYRTINSKVFFWMSQARLECLLNARSYRRLEHDVLVIDSARFIHTYADQIRLSPMNSGNTFPVATKRGIDTFSRIQNYPATKSGSPRKKVVELVVENSVPDIADYVFEVRRMKGAEVLYRIV
jgi:hypothetical protein